MRKSRAIAVSGHKRHALRTSLWLALVLAPAGGAQNAPHGSVPQPFPRAVDEPGGEPMRNPERLKMLNRERQKNLVSETNKLLKLAGELDMEVNGAHEDQFTPAQMRKIAEIEKLARSVKEKMTFSATNPSIFPQGTPPMMR